MVVHQTIEYNQNLPAKIRLRDGPVGKCRGEPHWHGEIELLYVDSGTLHVLAGNQKHTLSRGDVLAAEQNPFDEYSELVKYSLLLKMLRLLLTRCGREKRLSVYGTGRSRENDAVAVKHYIEQNYRRKIMIGELAALKNGFCHYNHFTKACHKYYGASPTELKKQRRQRDAAKNMPLVRTA